MKNIYLDNAATTMVCQEAAAAALLAMTETYGNPSSTHTLGRDAKKLLDSSRASVANALGCQPEEFVFTSCGSESDNWALIGAAKTQKRVGKHIISSMAEHDAIRKTLDELEKEGWEITLLAPNKYGAISVESVEEALRPDTALVSLMMVNNETGGITDINSISAMLKSNKSPALLHTDAVQGFLKVPFSAKTLGADLISISGHKIHAPKGIGGLYIRKGLRLPSFINGGSQENGRRAGTEAMPNISAFGVAAKIGKEKMTTSMQNMQEIRSHLITELSAIIPGLIVIDGGAPHILSISLPGYKSEVLMNYLERQNIYVSRSSACKKGKRSHVLEAMKLRDEQIDGTLRIGLSRYTTMQEADIFISTLKEAANSLCTVLH